MRRSKINNSGLEKISIGQKVNLRNIRGSEEDTFYGGVENINGKCYAHFYNKMNEEHIAVTLFYVSDIYVKGNQIFFRRKKRLIEGKMGFLKVGDKGYDKIKKLIDDVK